MYATVGAIHTLKWSQRKDKFATGKGIPMLQISNYTVFFSQRGSFGTFSDRIMERQKFSINSEFAVIEVNE